MTKAQIQYGKIITTQNVIDWEIVPSKMEHEVSLYTDREKLLTDVINSLVPITSGSTKKLEICIQEDSKGRLRIIKKWPIKAL